MPKIRQSIRCERGLMPLQLTLTPEIVNPIKKEHSECKLASFSQYSGGSMGRHLTKSL
jgi:hypothetical protein